MDFANEISAKVMGDILAKGMSLADVDLSDTVNSEAVKALGEILTGNRNHELRELSASFLCKVV